MEHISPATAKAAPYLPLLLRAVQEHCPPSDDTFTVERVDKGDEWSTTWRFVLRKAKTAVFYVRVNGSLRHPGRDYVDAYVSMRRIAEAQEYMRRHMTLPIPKVIAWGTLEAPFQDKHYIIVEAVSGVAPGDVWPSLTPAAQGVFVKDMARLLAQQATIPLPEAGSFLRNHLEQHTLISDCVRAQHCWKDEKKALDLLKRLRAVFPAGYEAMTNEETFIISQSDYNLDNNLFMDPVTGTMSGFFDFSIARLMPRLFDFAGPEWLVDAVEDLPDMPQVPAQLWTWTQRRLGIRTLPHHLGEVFRSELELLEPGITAKLKETRPFREWCRAGWLRGREDIAQDWIEEMNVWLDMRQ